MNGNNANDNNMMKGTNNNTRKRNNKQQESLNSSKHNKNHHQHRKQQQSKATNKQQQATQGKVYCCILVPDWFRLKKLCSCWHVDQPLQHVVNDKLSHGFFLFQPLWTRHYLTNQLSHLSLVIQRERSCLVLHHKVELQQTWHGALILTRLPALIFFSLPRSWWTNLHFSGHRVEKSSLFSLLWWFQNWKTDVICHITAGVSNWNCGWICDTGGWGGLWVIWGWMIWEGAKNTIWSLKNVLVPHFNDFSVESAVASNQTSVIFPNLKTSSLRFTFSKTTIEPVKNGNT